MFASRNLLPGLLYIHIDILAKILVDGSIACTMKSTLASNYPSKVLLVLRTKCILRANINHSKEWIDHPRSMLISCSLVIMEYLLKEKTRLAVVCTIRWHRR